MKRLNQYGSWDPTLEAKAREVMKYRFSESEDSFDFTLCARHKDGTIYGIAAGKQCRVGRPVSRSAALARLKKQGVPSKTLKQVAGLKSDKDFGKAIKAIEDRRPATKAITPLKPKAPSAPGKSPRGGVDAAAKRKGETMPEGRAEKKARVAKKRAEINIRRKANKKVEDTPAVPQKKVDKKTESATASPPKKVGSRKEGMAELQRLGLVKNSKIESRLNALDDEKFYRLVTLAQERAAEREALKGLSPKQKEAVRRVSGAKRAVKEGRDVGETRQTTKALVELYKNSKTGEAEAGQTEYPPEVAKRYLDFLRTGQMAVAKKTVSDQELDLVWKSIPGDTRNKLNSKGQPPDYIKRDETRGKMILRNLIETGFRDEITGQPYNWVDIQPDHKVPIALFKGRKEDLEKGNLVMTHKGYNNAKGRLEGEAISKNLGEEFVNSRLRGMFTKQAARSQQEFENILAQKLSEASVKKDAAKTIISNSKLWSSKDWVSNVQTQPAPILKALTSSMGSRSAPNRFQPSKSQGRNVTPDYSGSKFLAPALLLAKGVPRDQWPPGMWDKSIKALRSEIKRAQAKEVKENSGAGKGYDRIFFDRFSKFVTGNGGTVPIEYLDIATEMFA